MKILLIASVALFAAGGNSFEIVSMEEWSGEHSHRTEVLQNPVPMAVIQHTASPECATDDACQQAVKSIRNFHMRIGMTDIGYNFIIGGNGKVYEGAGWSLVGAHTKTYNTKSVGIAFIGDFREKLPTPDALQAAQDLLAYGLENKHLTEDYKLVGHRQLTPTVSPGDALQNLIEGWPHWTNAKSFR